MRPKARARDGSVISAAVAFVAVVVVARYFLLPMAGWWVCSSGVRKNIKNTPNPKVIVANHASNMDPLLSAPYGRFTLLGADSYMWFWELCIQVSSGSHIFLGDCDS